MTAPEPLQVIADELLVKLRDAAEDHGSGTATVVAGEWVVRCEGCGTLLSHSPATTDAANAAFRAHQLAKMREALQ